MTGSSVSTRRSKLSAGGLVQLIQRWMRGPESPDFPIPTQIAIAVLVLWLPLVILSLFEGSLTGTGVAQPLFTDLVPHVRFLIAIPILLVADLVIDPAVRTAMRDLETSGVVPDAEQPKFQAAKEKLHRARDSVWPDLVIIVLAFGFTWQFKPGYGDSALEAVATSWMWSTQDGSVRYTAAGWWYLLVSGPMFQVVLFRWLWRFLIWAAFLFRISRLPLALIPTQPDLAGGLGYLGVAQQAFGIVFLAFATVSSSAIAHDIISEGQRFQDERLEIVALVVALVAVIYTPLFFFSRQLFFARRSGLEQYGSLAHKLSDAFHQKWIRKDMRGVGADLLASTAPSAMADYTATFDNVRSMRLIPATPKGMMTLAGMLLVPYLPLVLTELSLQDLFNRLADTLV
jgi:hypothetical protein